MFGFPRDIADFGLKEYLRLVVIACAYVLIRPLFEKMFGKLAERGREREKKKQEAKMARQFKEQRVKERLGIEDDANAAAGETTLESSSGSSSAKINETAPKRKTVASMLRKKKPETRQEKFEQVMDDFDSDEDISDLIPGVSAGDAAAAST